MAFESPRDLNGFLPLLSTSDIRMKLMVGGSLFTYLEEPSNSVECSDIGMLIDIIVQWLSNSNPKVTQYGIDIISQLITRMQTDLRPYISTFLPLAVDRLGDSKEPIKIKALFLLMKLMECNIISPQALFDKISAKAFYHKNSHVKEGAMKLLLTTVEEFGANCITISKIVPMIVKLLSDPNVLVRHKAFKTLVELYKHVGEKLRVDIQKKYTIPQGKITDLMKKFDEIKAAGDLLPSAINRMILAEDETDRILISTPKHISNSVRKLGSCIPSNSTPLKQTDFVRTPSSASSNAGAVDEDIFIRSFEDVPMIKNFSARDLDDIMKKIHESIKDGNEVWNKRVESLKKIRSLVLTGAMEYEEFFINLRHLEHSFQTSIKDLRSQVVRETCITVAFLSQRLGIKFNHFAESIFSNLIDLVPNSAKVIASSGLVAVRFILENTHAPRIIPILANSLGSKSKDIRRACCEFFDQIVHTWSTQELERHVTILQDSIRKGIADANSEARLLSRKAYWGFCEHFPEQREILLNSLDPVYRKLLLKKTESNSCIPKFAMAKSLRISPSRSPVTPQRNIYMRSSCAIDLQTAQRANVNAQYTAIRNVSPTVSPQSVSKKPNEDMLQLESIRRLKGRVSISQPSSGAGSPSPKFTFAQSKFRRSNSGIPRSQDTCREASPNRYSSLGLQSNSRRPPIAERQKYSLEYHYTRKKETFSYDSTISQMSVQTKSDNHNFNSYKNCHTSADEIIKILDDLDNMSLPLDYKQSNLNRLKEIINDGFPSDLIKNFKKIIKIVLKLLTDTAPIIREQSINLITCMVQKTEIVACFYKYTELIILRIINMCCDPFKAVVEVAQECSFALSVSLQPVIVVQVITPLISSEEFQVKLMAIKIMTKLVNMNGSPPVAAQMKEIMSGLLHSYYHPCSSVRKAVVYCMVSLHKVLGEQTFAPYISNLECTKLKLLKLYIKRNKSPSMTYPKTNL